MAVLSSATPGLKLYGEAQFIKVDATAIPSLQVTVNKTAEWTEPMHGRMYQLELAAHNTGEKSIPNMRIEAFPAGCIGSAWNMQPMEPGRVYSIVSYYVQRGGVLSQQVFRWGFCCSVPNPEFVVRPF